MRGAEWRKQRQNGQALVMVAVSIVAMCGILGLAVDFGWAFYVKRAAQTAADAAALAAARYLMNNGSSSSCTTPTACETSPTSCSNIPAGTNLALACTYAQRNGFTPGGASGHQTVTIQANSGNAPTVPTVTTGYYATVRVSQTIPQLFSSVLGHPYVTVAARATGALTSVQVKGSLILLNRAADTTADKNLPAGTILYGSGNVRVSASGGIIMASSSSKAGTLSGSSQVYGTPSTRILGSGSYTLSGTSSWVNTPTNGNIDGPSFQDPMIGKGQPPIYTAGLQGNIYPILNGAITDWNSSTSNPHMLYPGVYYPCNPCGSSPKVTGNPITIQGNAFKFSNNGAGFGTYIFYGGFATAGVANITFAPGEYVAAGAGTASSNTAAFNLTASTTLKDNTATTGVPASDAGELFILTNLNYPGLSSVTPSVVTASPSLFPYGSMQTSGSNVVNIHGLNASSSSLPASLQPFAPFVFWQDQGNSHVSYTASGGINTSCSGSATINNPCANPNVSASSGTPQMNLAASSNIYIYGAMYQPRGAWAVITGASTNTNPLQIITGAIDVQGSGSMLLVSPVNPVTSLGAGLVE